MKMIELKTASNHLIRARFVDGSTGFGQGSSSLLDIGYKDFIIENLRCLKIDTCFLENIRRNNRKYFYDTIKKALRKMKMTRVI